MVKITINRSTGTNDPGRITQRVSQPGTLTPAGTAGQDKLRQVQEKTSFAIVEKQKRVVENNYLANARINASKQVSDLRRSMLSEMSDPIGFADNFTSKSNEIYEDILRNAPTSESRASLENVFAQQKISNYERAVATENKVLSETVLSDASSNLDQIAIDLFEEPSSFSTRLEDIDAIVDSTSEILSPIEKEKFEALAKKRVTDFYVKGLIDKNLQEADIFVNSDAISDIFDTDEVLKYRDAVERKKIQVNQELIKQSNAEQEAIVLDRELGIFRGTTSQLQLDEDLENNTYGIKEYINLSSKLRKGEEKDLLTSNSIVNVERRQNAGIPFDTTNPQVKKDLNTYYNELVDPFRQGSVITDPESQDLMVSTFIEKFAFIPDKVKTELLAGLHNGSDNEVLKASRLIESMTSLNPQLARQFSNTNDLARARVISSASLAGMPIDQAVKAADNMIIQKGTIEQDERRKDFKNSKPEFDQGEITSFFVNDPNTVPASMESDWRTLYENYAVNLKMSLKDASSLAYKIIESEWGISKVTGDETYIKHAPEKYYNAPGLDPEWMEKQLKQEVNIIDKEVTDYTLSVDPDTIGTETPAYFINHLSPHGIPLIMRDEEGRLLQWRPDMESSEDVKNQIEEKEKSFKDIHTGILEFQMKLEEATGFKRTI